MCTPKRFGAFFIYSNLKISFQMKELIKIKEEGGNQLVSARELYEFLGIGRDFTTWCKQMFEYGFNENIDYSLCSPDSGNKQKGRGGHNAIDYALTLDCAKEISMIQRSDKGKQARLYFIECEKKLKNLFTLPDFTKPAIAARAWADQFEGRLLAEAEAKENREDAMAYRELSQAIDCQTVQEFCKTIGVKPNLFYKWLRENSYLMSEQKFKNQPYQYYTHLFEIVMKKLDNKKATVLVTVINQKGVDYFTKKKVKGCFDSILKNKF